MCTGAEPAVAGGILGTGVTGAELFAGLGAAASAVGAASAIQQGQNQAKLGEYNLQVAQNQAEQARIKAAYDAERQRELARKVSGTQRSAMASAGGELLDMSDVIAENARNAEMDALAIRYGGDTAAAAARQQGILAKAQAQAAKQASYGQAASSLLTGAEKAGKIFV